MTKRLSVFVIALMLSVLSGCGRQEEAAGGYYDIVAESGQISNLGEGVDTSGMLRYVCLGSQFYQDERVQLWGEGKMDGGGIYLHREDGSRELLMEKVHNYFLDGHRWWLDEEGRCYIMYGKEFFRPNMEEALWTDSGFKTREGLVFRHEMEEDEVLSGICQVEDGRIIVLVQKGRSAKLMELDPDSGRLDEIQSISGYNSVEMIAAYGEKVLLLGSKGIWECSLEDGVLNSVIAFEGTSYTLKSDNIVEHLQKTDFRLLEDGRVELLWNDGTVEYINRQEVGDNREIIELRMSMAYSWMKEQVVKFNQKSEKYYISIEERGDADMDRFLEQTDMELGAGKGADLISSNAVNDMYSLLEKGVFEDLTPYMEASGIREEDYFPAAFDGWRYDGRIYGVNYTAKIEGLCIDKAIVGEAGEFGVEVLVNRLLDYEGEAIFQKDLDASSVLNCFLKDSESLCGMVDFEKRTCDFSGELFRMMLEAAERYGDEAGKDNWKCLTDVRPFYTFYCFNDSSYLEKEGKTATGYLFDDGGHVEFGDMMLAINVNSDKKDGTWEFISFLLGEEVQSDFYTEESMAGVGQGINMGNFPVSRSAFEKLCEKHNASIDDIRTDTYYNRVTVITGLTEERKEELRTALEEAKSVPLRTKPLIQIILEEADAYFSGSKSIDEVREIVENRVRLYLNEKQ